MSILVINHSTKVDVWSKSKVHVTPIFTVSTLVGIIIQFYIIHVIKASKANANFVYGG